MKDNLTAIYDLAKDFALQTNRNIFLTGKAGTGKTTFLHNLKYQTRKQMAVIAPTGVAAINAGGTTIHSFFQLPFSPFFPDAEGKGSLIEKIKMRSSRRKIIQELELLVIDEISMVRADTLDAVDTILRQVRFRHNDPFGGVQLIFIGDMFQLSPVSSGDEWNYLSRYYKSPYFFHSQVISQNPPVYIELDKIFRQSDLNFIKLLNEVRNNNLSRSSMELLQNRYNPLFTPSVKDTYITLTTHNHKADLINSQELAKLPGKNASFKARIDGDFNEKSFPTDKDLHLKTGAKVMLIKNDTETPRRFYNGKIGVIKEFRDKSIILKCPEDENDLEITQTEWENIRYSVNPVTKKIEEEVTGKFIQFPLRLAWAITIHKSQGLTFDKAIIDAGAAFAPGQVYVALSRCRNPEGMVLLSKINPESIENDQEIIDYENTRLPVEELEKQLDESRYIFRNFILKELFSFGAINRQTSRLLKMVQEQSSSFNDETIPFLTDIQNQLNMLYDVGNKFCNQLDAIFANRPIDENYLEDRLYAASQFFIGKLKLISETLNHSPATTDNRDNAMEYNDDLKTLFGNIARKLYIMKKYNTPFHTEDYFALKNKFMMPDFTVNAYSKVRSGKSVSIRNPKLYHKLIDLRNNLCEPNDTPIYLVANSKSLKEMSEYLPLSEKELMQIHGFGKAKIEKYGRQFLEIITEYCFENNLSSRIHEKPVESRTRKTTKKNGEQ